MAGSARLSRDGPQGQLRERLSSERRQEGREDESWEFCHLTGRPWHVYDDLNWGPPLGHPGP